MASSTTRPTAMVRPARVMMFRVMSEPHEASSAASTEVGSATAVTSVARTLLKNRNMITMAAAAPMRAFEINSPTDSCTKSASL